MNKIILDIGSHKLEEINFFFVKNTEIKKFYFNWWIKFFIYLLKKQIFFWKKFNYYKSTYQKTPFELGYLEHKKILLFLFKKRKHEDLKIIVVEPNINVVNENLNKFKKNLNLIFFPLAINNSVTKNNIFFSNFYIDKNSLSNSIYKKTNFQSVDKILSINMAYLIKILKDEKILKEGTEILLRMNCEGTEYEIIKDLKDNNVQLKIILGSLFDVMKIHGEAEYNNLCNYLKENNINYKYFKSSDPSTWLVALKTMKNFLENE